MREFFTRFTQKFVIAEQICVNFLLNSQEIHAFALVVIVRAHHLNNKNPNFVVSKQKAKLAIRNLKNPKNSRNFPQNL